MDCRDLLFTFCRFMRQSPRDSLPSYYEWWALWTSAILVWSPFLRIYSGHYRTPCRQSNTWNLWWTTTKWGWFLHPFPLLSLFLHSWLYFFPKGCITLQNLRHPSFVFFPMLPKFYHTVDMWRLNVNTFLCNFIAYYLNCGIGRCAHNVPTLLEL